MDNSPMWDSIMERLQLRPDQIPPYKPADIHLVAAEDRPLDAAYDRFAYLLKLFAKRDYDEVRIRAELCIDIVAWSVLDPAPHRTPPSRVCGSTHLIKAILPTFANGKTRNDHLNNLRELESTSAR
jgi:hypothetical protein